MIQKKDRKQIIIIALIALFLIALYGYRLDSPPERYFDEVYNVRRAVHFAIDHKYVPKKNAHPPLWHLMSAFCISVYGNHPWVWRIPSLVGGLFVVFLIFVLAKRITCNNMAAFLTAFLFTLDGVSITQARIAMLNSVMLMFMLLSLFCFLKFFIDGDDKWSRSKAFLWAGIFLGLGVATRMVASYMMIIYLTMIGIHMHKSGKDYGVIIRDTLLYLIFIPLCVFFSAYLFILIVYNLSFDDILQHFRFAYRNFTLKSGHNYGSPWWGWPFIVRPIWYYYNHDKAADIIKGVLCMGNQAIFWVFPISIGYLIVEFLRKKSKACGLILLCFFSQWLVWGLVSRVGFFHYFYTAMPFACMSVGILLNRIWQIKKVGRIIVIVYLLLVVGLFIYWYPLATNFPVSHEYYKHHMWFRSWI